LTHICRIVIATTEEFHTVAGNEHPMPKPTRQEFLALLQEHSKDFMFQEKEHRSGEILCQIIAYGTSIGAFGAIWEVLQTWISRHASVTVKVSYTAENDEIIELTYSHLTRAEAEESVRKRTPKSDRPVKIVTLA
jgi:hypothetical protein